MAAPFGHVKDAISQVKLLKYLILVNGNRRFSCGYAERGFRHILNTRSPTHPSAVLLAASKYRGQTYCQRFVDKVTAVRYVSTKTESGEEKRRRLLAEKEIRKQQHLERRRQKQEKLKSKSYVRYEVPTPPGAKKDTSCELPKAYSAEYVEAAWYPWWQQMRYFEPKETADGERENPFVVCLPPPNVTGTLHLGHALGNSIQDALIRWHRMCGRSALWVPGCDHAGIATQVVVEKKMWQEEKKTRHDVGRSAFVENVLKWKEEKGGIIYEQMKKMGCSLDWSRERFTLDPSMNVAVNEAFIRLHDRGLIYRDHRLVNWSCALNSAISDIEVDSLELEKKTYLSLPGYDKKIPFGVMTSFAYPVDGTDDHVVVSTTRPETMLGDTAVAVHPDDDRYIHLHGKHLRHPFCDRLIPIVTDESVQIDFGTGAVKITPAHDHNDFEIGRRHRLESLDVIDESGKMVNVPSEFQGMRRFDARLAVIEGLRAKGLLHESVDHAMTLPICSRSGDVVEPLLKSQWFVNCKDMANKAVKAVESGDLALIPDKYNQVWNEWLGNIRDWCISRQLWWGHRIPAYKVTLDHRVISETWVSGHTIEEAMEKAKIHPNVINHVNESIHLEQDEDVLDTWFSSAIFPFAVFGWPQQTEDLNRFYPISVMETAVDILFFWVARMVMMGTELTNQLPFNEVLLHGILRDSHGRKMSKSLGNVIDPMDVISGIPLQELKNKLHESNMAASEIQKAEAGLEKDFPLGIPQCGADALRFTLCSYNFKAAQFLNLDVTHIHSNHNFCNKIWQAFRFAQSHWQSDAYSRPTKTQLEASGTVTDRWILSRVAALVDTCNRCLASYDLSHATLALQQFWKAELCDVYLEYSKVQMKGTEGQRQLVENILFTCFDTGLRCLAPFMPFLSEELFQRLPGDREVESICIAAYPQYSQFAEYSSGPQLVSEMELVQRIVHQLLLLRKDLRLTKAKAKVIIKVDSAEQTARLSNHKVALQALSRTETLDISHDALSGDDAVVMTIPSTDVSEGCVLYVDIKDAVDAKSLPRLLSEQDNLTQQLSRLARQDPAELGSLHLEKMDILKKHITRIDSILQVFLKKLDH